MYTGKLGGPVAELAKLVGEVVSVEKVPITFDVQGGRGTIKLGDAGYAELEPYKSASGATTTLQDTVFSTVPGAPVFVGKSPKYRAKVPKLGIDVDLKGHNALQSTFVFNARPANVAGVVATSSGRVPMTAVADARARLGAGGLGAIALACRSPRCSLALSVLAWAASWLVEREPVPPLSRPWRLGRPGARRRACAARCPRARSSCRRCCTRWPGCS